MRPLSANERKAVLMVEIYRRQHGAAPTWTVIREAVGIERRKFVWLMLGLRKKGCLDFSDDTPGSTRTTPPGIAQAMNQGRAA